MGYPPPADDHAVEQVVGENAIASVLPAGAIHISCSTISNLQELLH